MANKHEWEESNFEITSISSSAKSWAAMTLARVVQDAAFKNCCLRSGRYDGANRNHFFPRVVSKQFLWAEELGLSL